MNEKKEIVKWSGGIPYGYYYDHDSSSIKTNSDEKGIILRVLDLRKKGTGVNNIAQTLNEMGLKSRSGKDWSNIAVGYLLNEKRLLHYAGFYPDGTKGYWESFINKADVKQLAIERETGSRAKKDDYLLSGLDILKCGYCGGSVKSSITFRKDGSKSAYYVCTNKSMKGSAVCSESKLVRQDKVNDAVINDIVVKYQNISEIEEEYKNSSKTRVKEAGEVLSRKQKEMRELLESSIENNNPKELENIKNMLTSLLKENEEAIKGAIQEFDFSQFKKSQVKKIKLLDTVTQKEIISQFIDRIDLFNDKLIIHYKFPVQSTIEL